MIPVLDGPRLAPLSGTTRHLVVLLHGYGADGGDLIEIGAHWRDRLPDTGFVAPHAPEPCPMLASGRQWFDLTFRDPHELARGVVSARPALDAFLDRERARHGLQDDQLVLVGFSQGAMMALHVGLRRQRPPAAIVGFSGLFVATPEELLPNQATPVLLIHGEEDDVIPFMALHDSSKRLAQAGVPCRWHASPGLGHGIDDAGLRLAGEFIAESLRLET